MRNVIEALQACVARPSPTPPGHVAVVSDWLESWVRDFGAEVVHQPVRPGQDNLIMTLDFGPGPTLVFNSHMDVNDPTGQSWSVTDPFAPLLVDGKLYGRGTCDAKGSLVAMVCAMERLAAEYRGGGKLVLTAVMGEEEGGIGSLHLVRQGLRADGAIVGEPTDLAVAIAHKGTYMKRLRFHGKAAHSGRAWEGINAVMHAARFSGLVGELDAALREHPHPWLGPASATITVFQGGTRQNTVPHLAEVILDRRLVPGESHAAADVELGSLLEQLQREIPECSVDPPEVIVATIPSETAASAAIVEEALRAVSTAAGHPVSPVGFSAGCDMSKLVHHANIPTVILGPGSLAQAHAPDEFVEVRQVEQAVALYASIAEGFLRRDASERGGSDE